MALFLKDIKIENVTLTPSVVRELAELFTSIAIDLNSQYAGPDEPRTVFSFFDLRHGVQGERIFDADHLFNRYTRAKNIERLNYVIETDASFRTNRFTGTWVHLTFDKHNPNGFLTVTSDDNAWVESTYARIHAVLAKMRNLNGWVRNPLTQVTLQLVGVFICFAISLSIAKKLAPLINVDNPFVPAFLFAFLLMSQLWAYLQNAVLHGLAWIAPNIEFRHENGKRYFHWLIQGIVLTIVGAIMVVIYQWIIALGQAQAAYILKIS